MNEFNPKEMLLEGFCTDCDEDPATCIANNKCTLYDAGGDGNEATV